MKTIKHTIEEYKNISNDVWSMFKKYFPDDVDTKDFTETIDSLEKKYNKNPRIYEFFVRLARVYFLELLEIKILKSKNQDDFETTKRIYQTVKDIVNILQHILVELGERLDSYEQND